MKRIEVKPGGSLSLQLHHRRSEHWVVVRGTARVTCGEPVWATFEEVARRSGKTESEIDLLIEDLKSHIQTGEGR